MSDEMGDEVYALKMGEVRAVIGLPGWQVITEVLQKRMAQLQVLIMQPEARRSYPISDERIRGEYFILASLIAQPEKLLESYEQFLKESAAMEEVAPVWGGLAEQLGMTRAGFPGQPVGESDNPE